MRNGYRATLARTRKGAQAARLLSEIACVSHSSNKCGEAASSLPSPSGKGDRAAVDRVLPFILDLRRSSSLFFIPLLPYPPLRGTFPSRGRLCFGDTAIPIQPPPLRGTSFQRKEGVSTRAPSLGRGCRAQRGGVGFLYLRRSRLLFAFPLGEGGPRSGG